jgi:hypothetical protein
MVKLDPGATVRVADAYPRPSQQQLSSRGSQPSNAKVVTDFTIFQHVSYGAGFVNTGWSYSSSEQSAPDSQFCYYIAPSDDGVSSIQITLAQDGEFSPTSRNNKYDIDTAKAAQHCTWFR